jgi:hypothetical protein
MLVPQKKKKRKKSINNFSNRIWVQFFMIPYPHLIKQTPKLGRIPIFVCLRLEGVVDLLLVSIVISIASLLGDVAVGDGVQGASTLEEGLLLA